MIEISRSGVLPGRYAVWNWRGRKGWKRVDTITVERSGRGFVVTGERVRRKPLSRYAAKRDRFEPLPPLA